MDSSVPLLGAPEENILQESPISNQTREEDIAVNESHKTPQEVFSQSQQTALLTNDEFEDKSLMLAGNQLVSQPDMFLPHEHNSHMSNVPTNDPISESCSNSANIPDENNDKAISSNSALSKTCSVLNTSDSAVATSSVLKTSDSAVAMSLTSSDVTAQVASIAPTSKFDSSASESTTPVSTVMHSKASSINSSVVTSTLETIPQVAENSATDNTPSADANATAPTNLPPASSSADSRLPHAEPSANNNPNQPTVNSTDANPPAENPTVEPNPPDSGTNLNFEPTTARLNQTRNITLNPFAVTPPVNGSIIDLGNTMFHAIFLRLSITYTRSTTPFLRRVFEFIFLVKSLMCLGLLAGVHFFQATHAPLCLPQNMTWDTDGILRLEILDDATNYTLAHSYEKEKVMAEAIEFTSAEFFNLLAEEYDMTYDEEDVDEEHEHREPPVVYHNMAPPHHKTFTHSLIGLFNRMMNWYVGAVPPHPHGGNLYVGHLVGQFPPLNRSLPSPPLFWQREGNYLIWSQDGSQCPPPHSKPNLSPLVNHKERGDVQNDHQITLFSRDATHMMEYAFEPGLLRLSLEARKRFSVPVTFIPLDGNNSRCLRHPTTNAFLVNVVGYNEMLIAALKHTGDVAGAGPNRGMIRDVVSGINYRFMSRPAVSFLYTAFCMLLFTRSVTLLLRFSQHQLFLLIMNVLNALDLNSAITYNASLIMIVALALIGMETVMDEFFADSSLAFIIICCIWLCDQYNSICCNQNISKKHWQRFFWIFHYFFYVYHLNCSGLFTWLALWTSISFIQYSMLYFYHHYELPCLLSSQELRSLHISVRATPGGAGNTSNTATAGTNTSTAATGNSSASAGNTSTAAGPNTIAGGSSSTAAAGSSSSAAAGSSSTGSGISPGAGSSTAAAAPVA